jgi:hypothetical protein
VATLDVLTLPEAKEALRGITGSRDADIEGYVTAVSLRLDDLCGPIVAREVTEVHHGARSGLVLNAVPYDLDTVVVTEQAEFYGTSTTVAAADLYVQPNGIMSVSRWFAGPVTVTYSAGRFADTASVSPLFKMAARVFLQHLWRRQEGGGSVTFGSPDTGLVVQTWAIPNAVLELLGSEVRGPVVA